MLPSPLFYCKNKDTYPPFKNGLYLEEYFLQKFLDDNTLANKLSRTYIPILWTNFQIEGWFLYQKLEMQEMLDQWVLDHPNPRGYFTVVQHDDGPMLKLPPNTLIFGACSGDIPIPLVYEDASQTLQKIPKLTFSEKSILCSFVGNITANHVLPNVRAEIFRKFADNPRFVMFHSGGWTPDVNTQLQHAFIETTVDSRFAFAPRGYGRSSFRFFECFLLGTIPVYVWNDVNWLPFQDQIDYGRLCIVLHVSELDRLESILLSIDENQYREMWEYYETIKHFFDLEGMSNQILNILKNTQILREKST